MQLTKELIFPAFETIKECLEVLTYTLPKMKVAHDLLDDEKYKYCFSVEEVNKLVINGLSFRDAYQLIGQKIASDEFEPNKKIKHSHIGSIGNS